MSTRARNIRPEVRDLISIAEHTPGWRVEIKVKRVDFLGPGGVIVSATLMADDKDLRQTINKLRRAGLLAQEGNGAAVSDLVAQPIVGKSFEQMSTDEKAMYVWTIARDFAIKADCEQQMHEGALYYLVKDKSIVDFIRLAFPNLHYEAGTRPSDTGMRPIYDYLRSHAIVVRKGQQAGPMEGNGVCISDSANPNKIKSEHRATKAAQKRAERPKPSRSGPVTTRRATVEPAAPEVGQFIRVDTKPFLVVNVEDGVVALRSAVDGHSKQVLLSTLGSFEAVTYDDLPAIGTLLCKPTGKTVYEVTKTDVMGVDARVLTRPGGRDVGYHGFLYRDELRKFRVITHEQYEALREANSPQVPEIVQPMTEAEAVQMTDYDGSPLRFSDAEPEVPVLVPEGPVSSSAGEEFLTSLDLVRQAAEGLLASQTGPDPVVEAQMAEMRREVAYAQAQAAHQQARAERAEGLLKQVRDAIENNAPKDAYPEIVRLVPPFPDEGLSVVS